MPARLILPTTGMVMLIKRPSRQFPDLCTYERQSKEMQIAMMHHIVSCVRSGDEFNITAISGAQSFKFVKLKSVCFRHNSVDISIKRNTGEVINIPIDLLVSIDLANYG